MFQFLWVVVHSPEDEAVSGLHEHSPPVAPGPVHLVQLGPAGVRHLVGHQPGLRDHDVRHGGVPLHEDRAQDHPRQHGRGGQDLGQVRSLITIVETYTLTCIICKLIHSSHTISMPNVIFPVNKK